VPSTYCNREWPLGFSNSEAPLPGDGTPDHGGLGCEYMYVEFERPYLTRSVSWGGFDGG
jgi:hypothetical protein